MNYVEKEEKRMAGYLFVHFTGEDRDGEQVYFSVSRDGLHWRDLNQGKPVLRSKIGMRGVRDPFPVRDPESGRIYLIATDLRIEAGNGWEAAQYRGSRDLIVWETEDLVHWSEERACTVGVPGAGCVWAPEAVYDNEKEQFFVFWASMTQKKGEPESKQKIYASWTKNFREFSEPFLYLERDTHVIDTSIIADQGWYYRISKDETNKCLVLERGKTLTGVFQPVKSRTLEELKGVEGPEAYLLPDNRTWCLIADRFHENRGYLPMLSRNLEKGELEILPDGSYDMGKSMKRHGGVLALSDQEYDRLMQAFS